MNSWLDGYLINCTDQNLKTFSLSMGIEIVYSFKKVRKNTFQHIKIGFVLCVCVVFSNLIYILDSSRV